MTKTKKNLQRITIRKVLSDASPEYFSSAVPDWQSRDHLFVPHFWLHHHFFLLVLSVAWGTRPKMTRSKKRNARSAEHEACQRCEVKDSFLWLIPPRDPAVLLLEGFLWSGSCGLPRQLGATLQTLLFFFRTNVCFFQGFDIMGQVGKHDLLQQVYPETRWAYWNAARPFLKPGCRKSLCSLQAVNEPLSSATCRARMIKAWKSQTGFQLP